VLLQIDRGIRGELVNSTDRTGYSIVNKVLLESEVDMLRGQELQYGCALRLRVYEYVRNNSSAQEQKCLVTQCVSVRRDGHY
jgi:hypothetical protein